MQVMEQMAPRRLAEKWDNVGLLLGNPNQEVKRLLVCLDVDAQSVDMALEKGVDMIISHHPLIFKALSNVRTDLAKGRLIAELLKNDIAVYAAHTNLDSATGGVNDVLAEKLGLYTLRPLLPTAMSEKWLKLAVFVPKYAADKLAKALGDAGLGQEGNYSHCMFMSHGTGHFTPLAGSNPTIGAVGKAEMVDEVRIESIFPESRQKDIITALVRNHPYEVPAYDITVLQREMPATTGLGRLGNLPEIMRLSDFASKVSTDLQCDVRVIQANNKPIRKVAVCGGSGAEFIDIAKRSGADVYVTGDIKYHEAQHAQALGLNVLDAGHFATENPVVSVLQKRLQKLAKGHDWPLEILSNTAATDVFSTTVCFSRS